MSLELARISAVESVPARRGLALVARPTAHSERVALSEDGRSASQELPAVPQGTVRWYRATVASSQRSGLAPELVTDADAPSATAASLPAPAARTAPGALAAYRAAMALGAGSTTATVTA